jgi:hypothetical protein
MWVLDRFPRRRHSAERVSWHDLRAAGLVAFAMIIFGLMLGATLMQGSLDAAAYGPAWGQSSPTVEDSSTHSSNSLLGTAGSSEVDFDDLRSAGPSSIEYAGMSLDEVGPKATEPVGGSLQMAPPEEQPMEKGGPGVSGSKTYSKNDAPFDADVLVAGGSTSQLNVSMAVASNGTIFIAYENETSPGNFDIAVAVSVDGGDTWAEYVAASAAYNEQRPAITVSGTAVTVFYSQDGNSGRVYLARSTNGGVSWTVSYADISSSDFRSGRHFSIDSEGLYSYMALDAWDTVGLVWTVGWAWTDDGWATMTGPVFWICHRTGDSRCTGTTDGWENWTRPSIATNATLVTQWGVSNPDRAMVQFFESDSWSGGDFSRDVYEIYYDPNGPGGAGYYYLPSGIIQFYVFGIVNTDEYVPDIASDELTLFTYTWDFWPLGGQEIITYWLDTVSTIYVGFAAFPENTNFTYPSVVYAGDFAFIAFFNVTDGGPVETNFVYSNDLGASWSEPYKVNANAPGTGLSGFHGVAIAANGTKPCITWQDDRSGGADVYSSCFGNYSFYTMTKSPADIALLGDGLYVNSTWYAAPVTFIWPWGSTQNISVNASSSGGTGTRFFFQNWSDGGARAHDITVGMSDTTLTANFLTQYFLTMSANFGNVTPGDGWYDSGTIVTIEAFAPPPTWPWGERYNWNGWIGSSSCGFEYTGPGAGVNHTATVTMMCPITEQASWNHQFYLDVNSPYGTTTGTGWYTAGFTVPFSVTPTTVSTGPDQRVAFSYWSGNGNGSYDGPNNPWTVTLNAPVVEDAVWVTEYRLTVTTNFGSVDPPGGWFEVGTSVNISAIPPAPIQDERYVWNGWTGTVASMANPLTVTINGPTTETADWGHEFYLTVESPYGTTSGEGWYAEGATPAAGLNTGTVGGTDTRQVFLQWSGDATGTSFAASNPITMNGPKTAVAQWKTQHYLTVTSAYGTTSGEGWYDEGTTTAVAGLDVGLVSGGPGTQYVFVEWGGAATGMNFAASDFITMNGPKTAIAQWKTQYMLTLGTNAGTVDPPSGWYDADTVMYVVATPPVLTYTTGERYVWNGWTGTIVSISNPLQVTMTGPVDETADWGHEFYLTVESPYGTTSGEGWYPEGGTPTAGLDTDLVPGTGTQRVFLQWSGDATGTSFAASNPITMNGPKTAVAQWKTQHYLTVTTAYGNTGGEGWYDEGTDAYASVDTGLVLGPTGTRYQFRQWTLDASGTDYTQSDPISMTGPRTAEAQWVTQYRITMSTNAGTTSPATDSWFDAGTTVTISAIAPNPIAGERFLFAAWSGTGVGSYTGAGNPATVAMNSPITETAQWDHEYFLAVVSFTGSPAGQDWYDSGTDATFSVQSPSSGGTGTQYLFVAWTGDSTDTNPTSTLTMNGPKTVQATWQTQFFLAVDTPYSSGSCSATDCWYDEGTTATGIVASGLEIDPVDSRTRYEFRGWGGAASGTGTTSDAILMDGPKTAVALWATQHQLTVTAMSPTAELVGVSVFVDGVLTDTTRTTGIWLDEGTTHLVGVVTPFETATERYSFSTWSSGQTSPDLSISITGPTDLTAQYVLATGVIQGTVRAKGTGAPVAGATVEAGGIQASTASDGTYQLTVPDGTYTVTVSHGDYVATSKAGVVVGIGETATVDFLVDPASDTDADGLPDQWELDNFGDLLQGPADDPDGDGFTNLQEWKGGTDPRAGDIMPQFWWLWLVLFLIFLILTLIVFLTTRRRGRPEAEEVYEELYGVSPAAEEVLEVEEEAPKKPSPPPPPAEAAAPAAAVKLPECPNCGLINEAGAKECAVCGAAIEAAPVELTTDERIAKLDEALKDGRITTEQYQANLKKLMGK